MADRIAGAIVDLAYRAEKNPKIAVEVLIGHGRCHAIIETTAQMNEADICSAVARITGNVETDIVIVPQDAHLSDNQADGVRCGDNGIFKGMPLTAEQKELSQIAHKIYEKYPADGKYILDGIRLIICQSNADSEELKTHIRVLRLIRSVTGQAARMWIQAPPTASWAVIWLTPLPEAVCTAKISPRQMSA